MHHTVEMFIQCNTQHSPAHILYVAVKSLLTLHSLALIFHRLIYRIKLHPPEKYFHNQILMYTYYSYVNINNKVEAFFSCVVS